MLLTPVRRQVARRTWRAFTLCAPLTFGACKPPVTQPAKGTIRDALSRIETMFADMQDLRYRVLAETSRGVQATNDEVSRLSLAIQALRERLRERIGDVDVDALGSQDRHAIGSIRAVLADTLAMLPWSWRGHLLEHVRGDQPEQRRALLRDIARTEGSVAQRWSPHIADSIVLAAGFDPTRVERELVEGLRAWKRNEPAPLRPLWEWMAPFRSASTLIGPRVSLSAVDGYFATIGAPLREQGVHLAAQEDSTQRTALVVFQRGVARRTERYPNGAEPVVDGVMHGGTLDDLHAVLSAVTRAVYAANIGTRPAFSRFANSEAFVEGISLAIGGRAYDSQWQRRFLGDSAPSVWNARERAARSSLALARGLVAWRRSRIPGDAADSLWSLVAKEYLGAERSTQITLAQLDPELVREPQRALEHALAELLSYEIEGALARVQSPKLIEWLTNRVFASGNEHSAVSLLMDVIGHQPTSVPFQLYSKR